MDSPAPEPAELNPAPKAQLLRILGVGFGIAVVFGGTIGVGILRLPGTVAAQLGNYRLILAIWVVGGIYALLGSVSVTELAVMVPRAGGFYVYARRAFGAGAGFAVGWGDWLNNCASLAYVAFAAAGYVVALLPDLAGRDQAVALAVLALFSAIHWTGLRVSSNVQKLTSSATALAFLVLAAACFLFNGKTPAPGLPQAALPQDFVKPPVSLMVALGAAVVALRAVVVAYDGWYEAIYFAEEDKNPARNLPRAMIGGVVSIIFLYLVMNLAFLHVLPIPLLATSKLPAADAAQMIFVGRSGKFITILSLLALLSFINSALLGAARIVFAIGRDGLFTEKAARVSAGGTPRLAMLLSAGAAMALVATGTFERIVAIAAIILIANYGACYAALIVLRRREPHLPRPFRAWGYPWTTAVVLAGSGLFLIGNALSDPANALYAGLLLGACGPAYLLMRKGGRTGTAG
jgi:APA family basic amino acid/polyamine antiporter